MPPKSTSNGPSPLEAALLKRAKEFRKNNKRSNFAQKVIELADSASVSGKQGLQTRLEEIRSRIEEMDKDHKETDHARRIASGMSPFIDAVSRYTNVISTMVSSNPSVTALLWGSTLFVVQIVKEENERYDLLTRNIQKLSSTLKTLEKLDLVFASERNLEVTKALTDLYDPILRFLEAAFVEYEAKGIRASLKFRVLRKTPVDSILDELAVLMKELMKLCHVTSWSNDKESRLEKKVNTWLDSTAQCQKEKLEDFRYNKLEGTGGWSGDANGSEGWLRTNELYTTWLTSKQRLKVTGKVPNQYERLLWITGRPGSGKSYLAASIIDHLSQQAGEGVVIHFFINGKIDTMGFLRGVIRQLIDANFGNRRRLLSESLPPSVLDSVEQAKDTLLTSHELAVKTLVELLQQTNRVYFVIDGLDECRDRTKRVNVFSLDAEDASQNAKGIDKDELMCLLPYVIRKLVTYSYDTNVRWCFTSCTEPHFDELFRQLNAQTIQLDKETMGNDIRKYFDCRMVKLKRKLEETYANPSSHEEGDVKQLIEKAKDSEASDFTFLELKITFDELNDGHGIIDDKNSLEDVLLSNLSRLQTTPGYGVRYLRGMLPLVEKGDRDRTYARLVVAFAMVAERPFTKRELVQALASATSDVENYNENLELNIAAKFRQILTPLLEVNERKDPENPIIDLTHRTAAQFLRRQSVEKLQSLVARDEVLQRRFGEEAVYTSCLEMFFGDDEARHLDLGIACVKYLVRLSRCLEFHPDNVEELERQIQASDRKYAFLKYACIFWHYHLDQVDSAKISQDIVDAIGSFMRSPGFLICCFIQSRYAPYHFCRLVKGCYFFTIQPPKDVYPTNQLRLSNFFYPDPIPKWLKSYNYELWCKYQIFVQEFGIILLRRNGDLKHCFPEALGMHSFIEINRNGEESWKIITLEDHKRAKPVPILAPKFEGIEDDSRQPATRSFLSVKIEGHKVRAISIEADILKGSASVYRWTVDFKAVKGSSFTRGKPRLRSYRRIRFPLEYSSSLHDVPIPSSDLVCLFYPYSDCVLMQGGVQPGLFSLGGSTSPLVSTCDCSAQHDHSFMNSPEEILKESGPKDSGQACFHGRQVACKESFQMVLYRWHLSQEGCTLHKLHVREAMRAMRQASTNNPGSNFSQGPNNGFGSPGAEDSGTMQENVFGDRSNLEADSEDEYMSRTSDEGSAFSEASSDDDSGSSNQDSSDGTDFSNSTSAMTSQTDVSEAVNCEATGWNVLIYKASPTAPPTKLSLKSVGAPLRQSPLCVHPTLPVVVIPIDYERIWILNYETGEHFEHRTIIENLDSEEEDEELEYSKPVSREFHFSPSGDTLFELQTTICEDDESYNKWDIYLMTHTIILDPSDLTLTTLTTTSRSSLSWVPPYPHPFDSPEHPSLPFTTNWNTDYLYLTFGACEAHIARIPLTPHLPIQTTQHPLFLPASTAERPFTLQPHLLGSISYFLISLPAFQTSVALLPPLLIWRDVEKDLGGWIDYDERHIGLSLEDEIWNVKGEYSCSGDSFRMAVRSGLSMNRRVDVTCGGQRTERFV